MRELKHVCRDKEKFGEPGRTPPGVRELKLIDSLYYGDRSCRTPPGVRELKLLKCGEDGLTIGVAPLPGCVN